MFLSPIVTKNTSPPAGATPAAAVGGAGTGSNVSEFERLLGQLGAQRGTDRAGRASDDETEDRFLKLLVAQMNNQDPLNPLDNAQVTSQMAQINTVRGIQDLNGKLQAMLDKGNGGGLAEASSMLGRRVLVEGNRIELPDEGGGRGGFELPEQATGVKIEILDRTGAVVDTRLRGNLPAGVHAFEWDGRAAGTALAPGEYMMRVTATAGERSVQAVALSAQRVQAVIPGADGALLQTGAGAPRPMSDVRAVL
jgi:flagellar basal-body rod modification protein FlgD